jgi:hypothetical protein
MKSGMKRMPDNLNLDAIDIPATDPISRFQHQPSPFQKRFNVDMVSFIDYHHEFTGES